MGAHIVVAFLTGLVLTFALPGPARAQTGSATPAVQEVVAKPIGKVVSATGSVTIERTTNAGVVQVSVDAQDGQMKVGDLVYVGDVVKTGADSRVGINFTDGTSFNLASNARMALDEFVYEPGGKSNSTMFNLTKGAFTFVAGKVAATGDMKIDTPVATMGIRGTTPHVEISEDGTAKFSTLIEEGKIKVTKKPGAPATQQPQQKVETEPKLKKICRGC